MSSEVMNLWQKKQRKRTLVLRSANNINIPYLQKLRSFGHANQLIKLVSPNFN